MSTSPRPDLLATIVAATRRAIEDRARRTPIDLAQARRPDGAAFARALVEGEAPRVIAECKRRSPSRGLLRQDYDPAAHAAAYASAGAVAVSVLTEPTFFDGAPAHLQQVRAAVALPLLRKDFIVDPYQLAEAVAWGADAVLLIAGALSGRTLRDLGDQARRMGLACLVEVHESDELKRALDSGAEIIGINSRNLRTLGVDLGVLDTLAAQVPAGVTAVAESGIRTGRDIERLRAAGYHAFLVGERLIAEPDPGAALRALRARAETHAASD